MRCTRGLPYTSMLLSISCPIRSTNWTTSWCLLPDTFSMDETIVNILFNWTIYTVSFVLPWGAIWEGSTGLPQRWTVRYSLIHFLQRVADGIETAKQCSGSPSETLSAASREKPVPTQVANYSSYWYIRVRMYICKCTSWQVTNSPKSDATSIRSSVPTYPLHNKTRKEKISHLKILNEIYLYCMKPTSPLHWLRRPCHQCCLYHRSWYCYRRKRAPSSYSVFPNYPEHVSQLVS